MRAAEAVFSQGSYTRCGSAGQLGMPNAGFICFTVFCVFIKNERKAERKSISKTVLLILDPPHGTPVPNPDPPPHTDLSQLHSPLEAPESCQGPKANWLTWLCSPNSQLMRH